MTPEQLSRRIIATVVAAPLLAFALLVGFGTPFLRAIEFSGYVLIGIGLLIKTWLWRTNRTLARAIQPRIGADVRDLITGQIPDGITQETQGWITHPQQGVIINVGRHPARDLDVMWYLTDGQRIADRCDYLGPMLEHPTAFFPSGPVGQGSTLVTRVEIRLWDDRRLKRWLWCGQNQGLPCAKSGARTLNRLFAWKFTELV
jgi:hypothetical protein